ncbi:ribulose-5-phosphate 4-epimerase/fuculose-1-phosphate aldolase [Stella humosa]|uniref:Ribulose-5-phosphate 4-epimerase/fuculose-1-phosphate aldolase n=1 Tax=Stella humosa TaxID=94 RepID=A0A3N1KS90_9PROT|nr:class II aldolase/adducin family protein [Stella humosa]ROP81260.1 ribulose-5-phosphate 4-epimerase/fuculose-1-phosphate aldolase [Stella humosa]BBK32608.1 class II aldolase [Stella humosa]
MDGTREIAGRSLREQVSDEEWALRVQLAACYRIIEHLGWSELIWSHTTARVPGPEHHFLINPYGLRYDEVTASNLVKIDLDGNPVGPGQHLVNPAGFVIHSAIHQVREDALCVMHTHTVAGMAVAAQEAGVLPVSMYALGFDGQVAYHDFEGPSMDLGERGRLAASLGRHNLLVLRTHGLLTCGRSISEAFIYMYRLQRACEIQLMAQSGGGRLVVPSHAVRRSSVENTYQFLATGGVATYGELEFDALVRLMDRKDPSFRE